MLVVVAGIDVVVVVVVGEVESVAATADGEVVVVLGAVGEAGALVVVVTGACVAGGATVEVVFGAEVVDVGITVVVVVVVVEMVTEVEDTEDVGPEFDAESRTELARISTTTVPFDVHVTVTPRVDEVDEAEGATVQPPAVPYVWKSPAEMPDTDSENVSV